MKKFAQSLLLIVTAAASFTACKKEAGQPETATPPAMEAQTSRDNFTPIEAAPKLVKKGGDSLVYNADGSLQKVIRSASEFTSYTKLGNLLTAVYFFNNVFVGKIEYTLDATGRATEAKHIGFASNNGSSPVFVYQYDASNRLTKCYNKLNPTVYSKFIWAASSKQLNQVKWYNGGNYESSAIYFTYKPEADYLKTWSKRTGLDSYLNIFGSRPAKMIASEDLQNYDNPALSKHEYSSYNYNSDGYPVKQEVHTFGTWAHVATIEYKYSQQ